MQAGVDLTITKDGPPDPVCARSWPADRAAARAAAFAAAA